MPKANVYVRLTISPVVGLVEVSSKGATHCRLRSDSSFAPAGRFPARPPVRSMLEVPAASKCSLTGASIQSNSSTTIGGSNGGSGSSRYSHETASGAAYIGTIGAASAHAQAVMTKLIAMQMVVRMRAVRAPLRSAPMKTHGTTRHTTCTNPAREMTHLTGFWVNHDSGPARNKYPAAGSWMIATAGIRMVSAWIAPGTFGLTDMRTP